MAINLLKSFLALLNLRPLSKTLYSYEVGSRELDASARNSFFNILWGFSVTLLVSYSFACHVS